ncbi:MAG: hypothetical protein PVG20_03955 [Thioalkalispiraceae bacterium]
MQLKFDKPVSITSAPKGVFHHLESSGRRSLAINEGEVAIVWEDNSSGTSQVYVAFKSPTATEFTPPRVVSTAGPAYEPVIAALGDQFVVGWEANEQLWLRSVSPHQKFGTVQAVSPHPAHQLTLVSMMDSHKVLGVWGEKKEHYYQLHFGELQFVNKQLTVQPHGLVDPSVDKTEQQYPSAIVSRHGTAVAWEDRRQGATRIMTTFAPTGQNFGPGKVLNNFTPARNPRLGRGTGAMRVVLAGRPDGLVVATWLDKRDFEGGYDVYAALSQDGGQHFEQDELVQDALGNNTPQWHPTVAVSDSGFIIAAWDDSRDGSPDIWYSLYQANGWSDDEIWPAGSGEGSQTLPILVFDHNTLHLAWLQRRNSLSSIHYIRAHLSQ